MNQSRVFPPRVLAGFRPFVAVAVASGMLIASGLVSGCVPSGSTRAKPMPLADSNVTTPTASKPSSTQTGALRAEVSDRVGLKRLTSLLVAPIAFDAGARSALPNEAALSGSMTSALAQELDINIVAWSEAVKPASRPSNEVVGLVAPNVSTLEAATEAGRLGLSGVLITTLHDFQLRQGSAVGSSHPAAVVFSVNVLDTDGQALWKGHYRFRDQALTDDLFKTKDRLFQSSEGVPTRDRFGFKSEEELLLAGFREAAQRLANDRVALFSPSE